MFVEKQLECVSTALVDSHDDIYYDIFELLDLSGFNLRVQRETKYQDCFLGKFVFFLNKEI